MTESTAPWITLQAVVLLVVLSLSIYVFRKRQNPLPFVLTPGMVVIASSTISSISAYSLEEESFAPYITMWLLQQIGFIIGYLVVFFLLFNRTNTTARQINRRLVIYIGLSFSLVSIVCALLFFARQGVPALQANLEQGRVDAAAEGTGYLRLLTYMSVPAALLLFCVKARFSLIFIATSLALVLALANRSPLLYLLTPAIVILAVRNPRRLGSTRIALSAIILGTLVVGAGTYRILSQSEFASYQEYREDIATGNVAGIATTSLLHYASVVSDNAVLAKRLSDQGSIPKKYGSSYLLLFLTALPGEQLSLDREIKLASGATFVGGGTPPTLMGEGYINFGYPGIVLSGMLAIILLEFWYERLSQAAAFSGRGPQGLASCLYGFAACWAILSQVAGFVGASTFPFAMFLVLTGTWTIAIRRKKHV